MILLIDRGNYYVKWVLVKQDKSQIRHRCKSLTQEDLEKLIHDFKVEKIAMIGTKEAAFDLDKLSAPIPFLKIDANSKLPFKNAYETPQSMGADRLCVAAAACRWRKEHQAVLVIHSGTCITIDTIDTNGTLLGGIITPGPELRYLAMHEHTARLPLVQRSEKLKLHGQNTIESVQQGGYNACIMELNGWIDYARREYSNPLICIGGKDGLKFANSLKSPIFVRPYLVQEGMLEILKLNEI